MVGGMLCKSDKPSIIIEIFHIDIIYVLPSGHTPSSRASTSDMALGIMPRHGSVQQAAMAVEAEVRVSADC